jgi:hypothetical protein
LLPLHPCPVWTDGAAIVVPISQVRWLSLGKVKSEKLPEVTYPLEPEPGLSVTLRCQVCLDSVMLEAPANTWSLLLSDPWPLKQPCRAH